MTTPRRRFVTLCAGLLGGAAVTGTGSRLLAAGAGNEDGAALARRDGAAATADRPAADPNAAAPAPPPPAPADLPAPIAALKPMKDGIAPITADERRARLEKARRLMAENRIDAILMEPGSTFTYFQPIRWWLSERPFVAVLPARGEPAFVAPGFEEARAREQVGDAADLRVWQEDESPYRLIAGILRDRGAASGRIGVEGQVRHFVLDGARAEAPAASWVPADAVTVGCRSVKSAAELALMQRANDMTIAAFRAVFATLHEGMTNAEMSRRASAAMERVGGTNGYALVLFGAASAFPHGTKHEQRLKDGDIVLVDGGCEVEGYTSDVTRTTVFGRPSPRQTEIWDLERRAQDAAFAAARPGATCESVDAAARKVIVDAGFGPDYRLPGLPHRTGHGIGLDGHEAPNFVRGEKTVLRPGMCFSDEPTIAIPGEFGIRLEDCLVITEGGARFFTPQSAAIDRPFD